MPGGQGNTKVRVVCRVRPQNSKELQTGQGECVDLQDSTTIKVSTSGKKKPDSFAFDSVFGFDATQQSFFECVGQPAVTAVMQGYNATVLAYGQTSSGKTHTMEGPSLTDEEHQGIIPRCVHAIFNTIDSGTNPQLTSGNEETKGEGDQQAAQVNNDNNNNNDNEENNKSYKIFVTFVEIYLERIHDLLSTDNETNQNLQVRENEARGIFIDNVTEIECPTAESLFDCMTLGQRSRAVAATGMNSGSSRSHSVFQVTVASTDNTTGTVSTGKLVLVDLAGSEKIRKTGAEGKRLEEAKQINKSLSALGMVINSLTDGSTHVPYRDSKLTRLLQDSLGGNSQTTLVIACSPSAFNSDETLSTCRFGARAKRVKNKVKANTVRSVDELERLLAKAQQTIREQRQRIEELEAQCGVPLNERNNANNDNAGKGLTNGGNGGNVAASTNNNESQSGQRGPQPVGDSDDWAAKLRKLCSCLPRGRAAQVDPEPQ